MKRHRGRVLLVENEIAGGVLSSAVLVGATTLPIDDVGDYAAAGGQIKLDPNVDGLEEIVTYTAVDVDLKTVTLNPGTAFAHDEGARANVYPRHTERWAAVVLEDDPEDQVWALVPVPLREVLVTGVRGEDDQEAVVVIQDEDGDYRIRDVAGFERSESSALPTPTIFAYDGALLAVAGDGRFYARRDMTIVGYLVSVGDSPTSASTIIDINRNGTTIFTNQANRPTITVGNHATTFLQKHEVKELNAGDYVTVDIDQTGGAGWLHVQLYLVES